MQCSSVRVRLPPTTRTTFGPGWVRQPKVKVARIAFVPCAWRIALVKASTDKTFTGVPPHEAGRQRCLDRARRLRERSP